MRSNRVVKLWVFSVLILLFTGCGGNSDDSTMVITYLEALADNNVDEVLEMTDPYQRSPRVDFHVKELAVRFHDLISVGTWTLKEGDLEKWTYSVVAKSDSTVRYRVTASPGMGMREDDFFIELVNRDDDWYVASIPAPLYIQSWRRLNYDHKRPISPKYPRYSEVFGIGSSIDSASESSSESSKAGSVVTRRAQEEMARALKRAQEEQERARNK